MVILRATRKVLRSLPETANGTDVSDNALGDWYVNRLVVDRRPLLLLVNAKSRLAMLEPARDVKNLPRRLVRMVEVRLQRLGVGQGVIASEVDATNVVRVGRTIDRSVNGQLADFARTVPLYLPVGQWDEAALRIVEDRFGETPCLASRRFEEVIFPDRDAVRLLERAWPASATRH